MRRIRSYESLKGVEATQSPTLSSSPLTKYPFSDSEKLYIGNSLGTLAILKQLDRQTTRIGYQR